MRNHSNLNRISKFLLVLVAFIIVTYNIIDYIMINANEQYEYNYVELKTRFKRYLVIDKYKTDSNYTFRLVNPVTDKEYKVCVSENLYYNIYFVGDTIK